MLLTLIVGSSLSGGLAHAGNGNGKAKGQDQGGEGKGNGNGNGNSGGNGKSESSNGNSSSNGHAKGEGKSDAQTTLPSTDDGNGVSTDQNVALQAVNSGEALPLGEISKRALAIYGGRLIDALLMRNGGRFVYRLTLVSDDGLSKRVFLDAKTAEPLNVVAK